MFRAQDIVRSLKLSYSLVLGWMTAWKYQRSKTRGMKFKLYPICDYIANFKILKMFMSRAYYTIMEMRKSLLTYIPTNSYQFFYKYEK